MFALRENTVFPKQEIIQDCFRMLLLLIAFI